jgi:hypothetical protein
VFFLIRIYQPHLHWYLIFLGVLYPLIGSSKRLIKWRIPIFDSLGMTSRNGSNPANFQIFKKNWSEFSRGIITLYNHYTFIPREGGYQSLQSLTSGGYKNKNVIFSQNLSSIHSRCFNHNSLRSCGVRLKICSATLNRLQPNNTNNLMVSIDVLIRVWLHLDTIFQHPFVAEQI